MLRALLALVALGPLLSAFGGQRPASDPNLERARRLLREVPVIDGHNDYPWEIRERAKGDLDTRFMTSWAKTTANTSAAR